MNFFILNVEAPLTELERADLIRIARELERAYMFKHNLIQETAYASLLKNDRKQLHRACAQALESAYPDRLDDYVALLAQHYMEAGDELKTFAYARRAGDAARRVHAYAEALMHYDTAVLLASRLPLDPKDIVHVYKQRGRTVELVGKYDEAVETYQALRTLGKTRGDAYLEMGALLPLATLYTIPNPAHDLEQAAHWNDQALVLARQLGEDEAEVRALWNQLLQAYFAGKMESAVEHGKQALALADRLGLTEMRAFILNDMSRAVLTTASVSEAMELLDEARTLWRQLGNMPMLADNLSSSAENAMVGGHWELAEQFAQESENVSQAIGNLWNMAYVNGTRAQIHALRGELDEYFKLNARVIELGHKSGFIAAALLSRLINSHVLGEMGAPQRGLELLNDLNQEMEGVPLFLEAWLLSVQQYLEFLCGDYAAARATLEKIRAASIPEDLASFGPIIITIGEANLAWQDGDYAHVVHVTSALLARLRATAVRVFMPDLLLRQARGYLGLGHTAAAVKTLAQAEELARDMQARPALWEILLERSALESRRGSTAPAHAFRAQAQELVRWIAAHTPADPAVTFGVNLRAAFLNQPRVRALLDSG